MKICVFTNHFFPEDFKVNDIVFEFAKKGYEITVITAIPDYPQGSYYDGYSLFRRRKEIVNGVKVIRLPIIPRGKGKPVNMVLNYISYFIASLLFTFFHARTNKYDAVFVHLVTPFFISLPAVYLKRRQGIPLILWVLDLWPESIPTYLSKKILISNQTKLVQHVYNNCDTILISSNGMRKSICEKGDYDFKIIYFPNWVEEIHESGEIAQYQGLQPFVDRTVDDFIILFAGNIGVGQNLDCIIDIAADLKNIEAIKFVFLGEGRQKAYLKNKATELGLDKTVFFLGRFPLESMPVFMRMADVLFVSLKGRAHLNLIVPAKIQFYMAQGKPILAMLNGDGSELITAAQCGLAVPVNDSSALKNAINELCSMPKQELNRLGMNGKNYYEQHFKKEQRMEQLDALFRNLVVS
ncbi:glycosyltransferase WbuB [Spirochaetia bacterium]|nr:glycosyltransferase WbuB [Spirochaetia bacterium]